VLSRIPDSRPANAEFDTAFPENCAMPRRLDPCLPLSGGVRLRLQTRPIEFFRATAVRYGGTISGDRG
jgi:hypothetical protein